MQRGSTCLMKTLLRLWLHTSVKLLCLFFTGCNYPVVIKRQRNDRYAGAFCGLLKHKSTKLSHMFLAYYYRKCWKTVVVWFNPWEKLIDRQINSRCQPWHKRLFRLCDGVCAVNLNKSIRVHCDEFGGDNLISFQSYPLLCLRWFVLCLFVHSDQETEMRLSCDLTWRPSIRFCFFYNVPN